MPHIPLVLSVGQLEQRLRGCGEAELRELRLLLQQQQGDLLAW
ncbi:MAG TPA: hypothetical protein VEO73_11440 [Gemmatimonadales bacterium]|nr:hypothetical protein [Gemmatimonadales bacterium]